MKKIRQKVFETNSSSSHSISISDIDDGLYDTIIPNENGDIVLTGGEFGWEWLKFNSALTKANYCAVDQATNPIHKQMLEEVLKKQTGCNEVLFNYEENGSYIDHDSTGTAGNAFVSKEVLRNFIFNKRSWLFTGNDNESAPPNFKDDPDTIYNYLLILENGYEYKLINIPKNRQEFINKLSKLVEIYCDDNSHETVIMGGMSLRCSGGDKPNWSYYTWGKQFYPDMTKFDPFIKVDENIIIIYNDRKNVDLPRTEKNTYGGSITHETKEIKFEIIGLNKNEPFKVTDLVYDEDYNSFYDEE